MKIALWQTSGYPRDVAANLAALEERAHAAALGGAALLLCPECWLCGYNIGDDARRLAEERAGPSAQRIAAIARRHGVAIAYGYAELERASGRVYNAAQVIAADGQPLAHYRKTHLWDAYERSVYQPGGSFAAPFRFGAFCVGLLICYDVEFPESARALMLAGADLLLVPTALSDEFACIVDFLVPARAVENQIFIAYCNHCGEEDGVRFLGGSRVCGVDGRVLAAAGKGEALLLTELDPHMRARALAVYSYRADRRPELYGGLSHDERER